VRVEYAGVQAKRILSAAWVAPMDGPVVRDGAVAFADGRIIAVGASRMLRAEHPDASVEEAGDHIILPGLVNAHTHLELSDCARGERPVEGFALWLKTLIRRTQLPPDAMGGLVPAATQRGVEQCLGFGVTTVGDISRQCHLSRPVLRNGPLRAVSFGEVQALGTRRVLLEQRLAAALDESCAGERLRIGLTPHAPYTVEPEGYRRCLQIARDRGLPLATHLAETPDEEEFLQSHSGPLGQLWDYLGTFDRHVPKFTGGPIRLAASLGLLDHPTLLAHVNYCDDEELSILAQGRASVVWCPRTHAFFGHAPHRWRDMLARGINVAVGTDSCASSPDLNLVDDLRLLHRLAPEAAPQAIWEMATIRAARALGMADEVGTLSPSKAADFAIFAASGDDPLRAILQSDARPAQTWIAGQRNR
jgi:cytosine/adenosine deaminase-related metal-dependent hydrolase